jgi:hypothetical protein
MTRSEIIIKLVRDRVTNVFQCDMVSLSFETDIETKERRCKFCELAEVVLG